VTTIVLFHSMLGLRPAELDGAERLRAAGHPVVTPDLYAGATASTLEEGFAVKDAVGWETIVGRARDAVAAQPADAVLVGVSMGAGVVHELLPGRPHTAGVLLLHGLAPLPASVRAGLPVEVHVADPDDVFAPPAQVAAWREAAARSGADARVFTYPGAGHFYTDADGPDHDAAAAARTWQRATDFVRRSAPGSA
jgi:dienelactone hydrolase